MSNRNKKLILCLLFMDMILLIIIIWVSEVLQWAIWVRQTIIAVLFVINLIVAHRYQLK